MKRFLAALMCLCLVVCMLPAQIFAAEATELTISFADTANRTSFSTSEQVWEQNGIKVTNGKGSGSNLGDYSNPLRLYAKTNLKVEVPGMLITKIVFATTSSTYATVMKNSIGSAATASGNNISISFAEPVESYSIASFTAQTRVSTMTVTATAAATEPSETTPESSETTPESSETTPESSETTPESSETPSESTPAVDPSEMTALVLNLTADNRTSGDSNQQTFEENGVKLVNQKASASSPVNTNYANPARFYKGSTIEFAVTSGKIAKIVVNPGSTGQYATPWEATLSAVSGATVTANSDNTYTIELATPVESLTVSATAQIRASVVTVYVVGGSDTPVVPTAPSAESAAFAFEEANAGFAAGAALPGTFDYKEHTFTVAWAVETANAAAAYIEDGVLKTAPQAECVSYKLIATISLDADSATVEYKGAVLGTEYASEATISFADAAARIELNSDKQVWIQNNIIFTNNKAEATSAVADYVNPVRLYKNSTITVEYPAMWSIVFDGASASYIAGVLGGIDASTVKSVVEDGDKVTVTFNEATDSFTVKISEAARLDAITVSQVAPEEPVEPDVPSVPTAQDAADAFKAEYADFAADTALPTTYAYNDITYTVAWTIESSNDAGAYIEDGVLKLVAQDAAVSYTLTATLSAGEDSASVSYTATIAGTAVAADVTMSFADTTSRLSQTTEQQVWQYNGVTLTNDKASSTSNIADTSNPLRLYKNTSITVEYPAMLSITFDCNTSDYATALASAIGEAAVQSGDIVVVNFAEPTDSFTVLLSVGQVRLDSMTVSQKNAEAPEAPVIPDPEEISIVDANTLGAAQATNQYTAGKYYVTGKVSAIASTQYGNLYIEDEAGNTFYIYGLYSADGTTRYDKMETAPVVGDTITVLGPIGNYNGTPQMKNGWMTAHTIADTEPEEPVIPDPIEASIADVIEIAMSTLSDIYSAGKYIVTGTVVELQNTQYGNLLIEDEAGDQLLIYGTYNEDGTVRYDSMETKPLVGDTITVMGVIGNHSGTPQIKNGWVIAYTSGGATIPDPIEASIADVIEIAADREHNDYTLGKYIVTGVITEIKNATYGNLYIEDEAGDKLYVYGAFNADGSVRFDALEVMPAVGDTITVMAVVGNYNGTPQMLNGWIIAHEAAPAVAKVGETGYATLAAAIAAAGTDGTVTLVANINESTVEIPVGVTLDLAGCTLNVESIVSFGQIIDSSDAEGGIVATNIEATGNAMLPLADNGTYRFFAYELKALGSKTANVGAKFGFAIDFANAKAYELIAGAEDVGVTVSMTLTCGETAATYAFDAALVKAYAALHIANPGRQAAMILTVTGLDAVDAGTVLSVATSVAAAGNVNVSADAMTYTK